MHAAFSFSMYTPPLILLPFAAPLIKRLAHYFPDEGLSRVKAGRQVIIDIVKELLAERRQELAVEKVRHAHACCDFLASHFVTAEPRRYSPTNPFSLLGRAYYLILMKALGHQKEFHRRATRKLLRPMILDCYFLSFAFCYRAVGVI